MKRKVSISALTVGFLTLTMLIVPAFAQYNVTLRLVGPDEEILCEIKMNDVDNMTLTVPEPLYTMINNTWGTDTFTAPVNLTLPTMPPLTLQVISVPPGWTVTFEPLTVPDLNGDFAVDVFDLVEIAGAITVNPGSWDNYNMLLDLNFDLTIDIFDLAKVAKQIEIP